MEESRSFRDRLLANICGYDYILYLAFTFQVVLLMFGILAYLFADLEGEARYILLLDFALLGFLFVATVGLIAICRRRK